MGPSEHTAPARPPCPDPVSSCTSLADARAEEAIIIAASALLMMAFTCKDLDYYASSPEHIRRHVAITVGALKRNCGWSAHPSDRRMDAEDLVFRALEKLRAACEKGDIEDLFKYLGSIVRNDAIKFCMKAKRTVPIGAEQDAPDNGDDGPPKPLIEAVFACARARLPEECDRVLFDLYVEGKPNRAMREVDPRGERQITRLREKFMGLLQDCARQIDPEQ